MAATLDEGGNDDIDEDMDDDEDAKPKKKLSRAARRELSDSEGDDDHNDLDFADTRSEASVGSLYSERTLDLGGMNRGHASSASLALPDGHYHDDGDDDDDSDGEGDGYYEDDRALKERGKISAGVGDLSEKRGKTREDALTSLRETLRNFHESHGPLLEAHSEELLGGAMASLRRGGREGALAAELLDLNRASVLFEDAYELVAFLTYMQTRHEVRCTGRTSRFDEASYRSSCL